MNAQEHLLYAIVDTNGKIHEVDYTLAEAADFLLTADSRSYEVREEDGRLSLYWSIRANSTPRKTGFSAESDIELFGAVVDCDVDWSGYTAVPQHQPSGWWKIGSEGGTAVFGWGSEEEADAYAQHRDDSLKPPPTAVHHVLAVSWHDAYVLDLAERGELNLDDALQAIREAA